MQGLNAVEDQLPRPGTVESHLGERGTGTDTRPRRFNKKRAHAARSLAGSRHDDVEIGVARSGDKGFCAVEDVVVSVTHGACAQRHRITPAGSLGERERSEPFATSEERKIS